MALVLTGLTATINNWDSKAGEALFVAGAASVISSIPQSCDFYVLDQKAGPKKQVASITHSR